MDNGLDNVFSALADPTRRAIIQRLIISSAPVSELHAQHKMALPSFLKHLGKLESAGMIRSEKKGRVRTVHLESAPFAKAENWLNQHKALWDGRLNRLSALAEQSEKENDDG